MPASIAAQNPKPLTGRDAYRNRLATLSRSNPKVFCVDSDMGGLESGYAVEFPDRYADVGIAEANLISVAAGLAKVGWIPFANTMATFASTRACEQIKLDVAYAQLPVKVVGSHAGVSAGHLGPTHHALEDIAVMRAMPGMSIVVPSSAEMVALATEAAVETDGPFYLRLSRNAMPFQEQLVPGFQIGVPSEVRPGNDLLILACGPTAVEIALDAATQLQASGVSARVMDVHTIKPLHNASLLAAIEATNGTITIEEHSVIGGLGSIVAELVAEVGLNRRIVRIGADDCFVDTVGDENYLLDHLNINVGAALSAAASLLNVPIQEIRKE